ncbi:alkene reductase [Ulvibacter antarcticus]|uniref:N-ethylmaleimide reductase n=1 Tax=Ulvibacter antarcticus TaxID=442714 RepID=A0A3L9Z1R7_9FLAO|nr:alkene reductase [Ulvibacter antarcticus]RMA64298.1 N-ethylmaleimide reductase [Ulvibacter antarcticus]
MNKEQAVLQPYTMGDLELPNRVVMAPMTRSRAKNNDNAPTEYLHAEYYTQRATAGLIITEGAQVSKRAVGYIHTAGIHSKEQVEGWKKVTESVHEAGGRIFIQLWHVGRISHPDFHNGELPWAPSAINPEAKVFTPDGQKDTVTPKAMTQEDIDTTIKEFQQATKNAVEAGFDGVEIHSSNGYLFHQFFNNYSNKRTDTYGGSDENKARFFFEVLDAIKEVIPENRIGARFNPSLHGVFGMKLDKETIPTFDYVIERLSKEYDLAYIHLSEPFTDVSDVPHAETEIAKRYRPKYKGTLMINTGFTQEKANKIIEAGNADLVAFAKLFVSNPDLVGRFRENVDTTDWDKDTFYTQGKEGYIDYKAKTRDLIPK